jgi:hypothetical protein
VTWTGVYVDVARVTPEPGHVDVGRSHVDVERDYGLHERGHVDVERGHVNVDGDYVDLTGQSRRSIAPGLENRFRTALKAVLSERSA